MNKSEQSIQKVWDYMKLNHQLEKVDAIIAFGSYDPKVGEYAAQLFLDGYAPLLIFSGGQSDSTTLWDKSEAETAYGIALAMGVPANAMIIESQSSNSGENIIFTQKILQDRGIEITKAIIVQKPFMERRVYATLKKQWPQLDIIVTSPPQLDFRYYETLLGFDGAVGDLLGAVERIKKYPELGYQIKQDIPDDVWNGRCVLRGMGYCIKQIDI